MPGTAAFDGAEIASLFQFDLLHNRDLVHLLLGRQLECDGLCR